MCITPYPQWPEHKGYRWIMAAHIFGRHLMMAARDYSFEQIPASASQETKEVAKKAAFDAIYGMMMLLDGIHLNKVGDDHVIDYALRSDSKIWRGRRGG